MQLVATPDARPLANRARFRVESLAEAAAYLDAAGVPHSTPSQLPGVVAFLDFTDPWGNHLGYYQDLAPSAEALEYRGSSVRDESLFARHRDKGA